VGGCAVSLPSIRTISNNAASGARDRPDQRRSLGILIGSALYELPGAFLAVPVAGAVQVLLAHGLQAEERSQAHEHADPAERVAQEGVTPELGAQKATTPA
jgi:hypothetical protein